jgi:hypothetical protein
VTAFSLYDKTSALGGVYVMLIVNRMQLIYFFLVLPRYLLHPYMIWGIVAMGILSQVNLMMLSKWFSSDYSAKGYQGFVELFGERAVRFFVFTGLFLILLKITVSTLIYVKTVQQFVFPSMNINWLILFTLLISCYVAAQGMENTIRFSIISFSGSFWIILLFCSFFFLPIASLHDLYPLIPTDWSMHLWKALLFVLSSLSGPEYLICLAPWLRPQQKMLKYLTLGNAITVLEYLIELVASLLFFGSQYLSKTNFPVVNMMRYLQSPVFERIDIILLSAHMFHFVFIISILLLCFYGATRIVVGRLHKQTTRIGFISSCITIFVCIIMVNKWFWTEGGEQNDWLVFEIWSRAVTYLLVPAFLLVAIKRRGRV